MYFNHLDTYPGVRRWGKLYMLWLIDVAHSAEVGQNQLFTMVVMQKKKIKMNIYMRYLITVKYMTNRLEFSSYEAHMCRGKT